MTTALMESMPSLPVWAAATVDRLLRGQPTQLDRLWAHPEELMIKAGMEPDPWQNALLRSTADRLLLLCSRQSGKSQTAAALALQTALVMPGSLSLLLSPTLRQSGELFRDKVLRLYNANGRPLKATQETALQLTLANGSRIVSLPGEEGTIRGYSGVALLVIDEAARVSDELYRSVRPMLAVSGGRLICLSTPFGKRGFFYEACTGTGPWERYRVSAEQCPRITQEFLKEERREIGDRWFAQEYGCEFMDMAGAVFSGADIDALLTEPCGEMIEWPA
jgi:hypothetical protein